MRPSRDAFRVLQDGLGIGLAEAARITVLMSGAELDLVESESSPVAIAALVYQAQLRAARRITDPDRQRAAIAALRADAARHHQVIRARVPIDFRGAPAAASPDVPRAPRVYSEPPPPAGRVHA